MVLRRLLLFALIAMSPGTGTLAGVVPEKAEGPDALIIEGKKKLPGLALELVVPKKRYVRGQPIELTMRYTYAGERKLRAFFVPYDRSGRIRDFWFSAEDGAGNPVRDPIAGCTGVRGGGLRGDKVLSPGRPYEQKATINEWLCFDRPGRYRVKAHSRIVNFDYQDRGRGGPPIPLESNAVEIEIVPFDEERRVERIAELGRQLKSGDKEARQRAVVELRFMVDERAIPLLVRALEDPFGNVVIRAGFGLASFRDPEPVKAEILEAVAGAKGPLDPEQISRYAYCLAAIDARAATKGKKTDWRLRWELNKRWRERLGKISEARPDRLRHVKEGTAANEPRLAGDPGGGRKLSMDGARPEKSSQAALHETGASASARSAARPPSLRSSPGWRRRLASDEPLKVIRMLCVLAEKGDAGRDVEEAIAGLLTETARGKVLSRWCYYALTKISANPQQYLDKYVAAAAGLRINVVPPGQEGVLAGPVLKTADEPELPEGLRKTSHVAWVTGVDAVVRLLHDDRRWYSATDCLDSMGAPGDVLVPRLATALLDSKIPARIRQRVSMTIGEYGFSTVAEKALLTGLGHEDADTRGSCARALGRLCGSYRGRTEAVTHPHPEVVVAALTEVLKDPEAAARKGAACGLGWARRNDKKAVDLLLKIIRSDPDPVTRRTATITVGRIACELRENADAANPEQILELARAVVPVLVEVLRGEPRGHQRFLIQRAARSLGYFGEAGSKGVPELHRLLRSATGSPRDQQLRAALVSSLGHIGPASDRAIPEIVASSRYECCRYPAAFALGKIGRGGEDVEKALLDLTQAEEHWIRREAAKSLGLVARESEQIIKALERLGHDRDDYVREEAAKALFAIHARATGTADPGADDVF